MDCAIYSVVHRSWVGEQMLVPKLTFFGSCLQWFRNVSSYPKSYLDCQRLWRSRRNRSPTESKRFYELNIDIRAQFYLIPVGCRHSWPRHRNFLPHKFILPLLIGLNLLGKGIPTWSADIRYKYSIRFRMQKMLIDLQYISSKKNPIFVLPRLIKLVRICSSPYPFHLWSATCEAIFT